MEVPTDRVDVAVRVRVGGDEGGGPGEQAMNTTNDDATVTQELFGLDRTPRVAGRRVQVLVHLLAPKGRPQQVTDDLASFWSNADFEMRKELRRRYPKHAWPEDPTRAQAERRPGRGRRG